MTVENPKIARQNLPNPSRLPNSQDLGKIPSSGSTGSLSHLITTSFSEWMWGVTAVWWYLEGGRHGERSSWRPVSIRLVTMETSRCRDQSLWRQVTTQNRLLWTLVTMDQLPRDLSPWIPVTMETGCYRDRSLRRPVTMLFCNNCCCSIGLCGAFWHFRRCTVKRSLWCLVGETSSQVVVAQSGEYVAC